MSETAGWRKRRLREGDLGALVPLLAELCAGDEAAAEAAVSDMLLLPGGGEAWVLTEGGAVLGFVALTPSSQPSFHVGFVDWIAVDPAHRRRGIGLALLQLAQDRARALGWRQLHAYTFHTNRSSLHLYIEGGFYPAATLHDYCGPGLHYVQMVWQAGGRPAPKRRPSPRLPRAKE